MPVASTPPRGMCALVFHSNRPEKRTTPAPCGTGADGLGGQPRLIYWLGKRLEHSGESLCHHVRRACPRKGAAPTAAVSVNSFNNEHDGANCLRCGYRVDDARAIQA